jgi:hypothetical protein
VVGRVVEVVPLEPLAARDPVDGEAGAKARLLHARDDGPDPELTWRACGERFDVTPSRVAQIVARAIRVLRRAYWSSSVRL